MRSAQQMFDDLVQIMRPLVEAIESTAPTTVNHYGEYITTLTRAADTLAEVLHDKPRHEIYIVLGAAMFRAGANPQGLRAALRILGVAKPKPREAN